MKREDKKIRLFIKGGEYELFIGSKFLDEDGDLSQIRAVGLDEDNENFCEVNYIVIRGSSDNEDYDNTIDITKETDTEIHCLCEDYHVSIEELNEYLEYRGITEDFEKYRRDMSKIHSL